MLNGIRVLIIAMSILEVVCTPGILVRDVRGRPPVPLAAAAVGRVVNCLFMVAVAYLLWTGRW